MRAAYGNARASTLLIVEFYAKWCNSCRRLYPRLCRLAAQESDVLFVKVEFDECKDLCRKLGVVKLPYFHVYNGSGSRLADYQPAVNLLQELLYAVQGTLKHILQMESGFNLVAV